MVTRVGMAGYGANLVTSGWKEMWEEEGHQITNTCANKEREKIKGQTEWG